MKANQKHLQFQTKALFLSLFSKTGYQNSCCIITNQTVYFESSFKLP